MTSLIVLSLGTAGGPLDSLRRRKGRGSGLAAHPGPKPYSERSAAIQMACVNVHAKEAVMLWIRIFIVTPVVLVMGALLLTVLALQAAFAGKAPGRL